MSLFNVPNVDTVDPRLSERLGTKTLLDNRNLRIIEVLVKVYLRYSDSVLLC